MLTLFVLKKRDYEAAINCLNSTGLPKPLNRLNRVPKHNTTEIIPSDGFNEKDTTKRHDFADPQNHAIKAKPILKMIHRYNLKDLNLPQREAKAPMDLTFKTRQEIIEKQNWETTMQSAFGAGQHLDAKGETFKFKELLKTQAGIHAPRQFENQGVKCSAGLCGEVYKANDP